MNVLGALAGTDLPPELLKKWCHWADVVVAADGALNRLLDSGEIPHVLVGDLDSVDLAVDVDLWCKQNGVELSYSPDQNTTDCDKLLEYALGKNYAQLTLCDLEGDRPDHFLSTLGSAIRSPLDVRLAMRKGMGYIIQPGAESKVFSIPMGTFSLLPLTTLDGVNLLGAKWELTDDTLEVGGSVSVSNQSEGKRVSLSVREGTGLLFIHTDGLPPEQDLWLPEG